MKLIDYQRGALRTAKGLDVLNWSLGLAGETGEVIELVKKWKYHGAELNRERLLEELGDVLWYLTLLANSFGFTLEEIAARNLEKLEERYGK